VILFDEIEKAHPEVFNVLLQLLDDGRLTDGQGRTVDFRNTVVIMTSNLGTELWGEQDQTEAATQDQVRRMLAGHFRPEFLNRIDEIVVFQRLTREDLARIVGIQLSRVETRLAEAKAAGKPAILDYYADWCTDCLRMEKATFADARVRADLEGRFVRLQVDVTNPADPEVKAIKGRFGVYGPPALLFFGPSGVEQRALRTYGFRAAEEFLALLRKV